MKTLLLCFTLAVLIWPGGTPSSHAAEQTNPPNVIIVLSDDQGYGDLSRHGNPILKTPHLDRLRAESLSFSDFHVAPVCPPYEVNC